MVEKTSEASNVQYLSIRFFVQKMQKSKQLLGKWQNVHLVLVQKQSTDIGTTTGAPWQFEPDKAQ